jgi:hypothetical protein
VNRIKSHLDEVNMIGKLADLKSEHYNNTLILSALVELLIEKKVITQEELTSKAEEMDTPILGSSHPIM